MKKRYHIKGVLELDIGEEGVAKRVAEDVCHRVEFSEKGELGMFGGYSAQLVDMRVTKEVGKEDKT